LIALQLRYVGSFDRQPRGNKNNGVSTVSTLLHPHMFATGGFDHTVHLWNMKEEADPVCGPPLAIKHTAMVQSLLSIRDSSQKLLSAGADCKVHVYDLAAERASLTFHVFWDLSQPSLRLIGYEHYENIQFCVSYP
jgi:WD40 repeat protein